MSETLSTKEQLIQLKAITERTGAIHEAQAMQLRMWPLLIPQIQEAQVSVDTDRHYVIIKCKSDKFRNTKKAKLTYSNIETWVQQILWDDTVVFIDVNDRKVYPDG